MLNYCVNTCVSSYQRLQKEGEENRVSTQYICHVILFCRGKGRAKQVAKESKTGEVGVIMEN